MLPNNTRRGLWLNTNVDDNFGRLRHEMDTVMNRVFGPDAVRPQAVASVTSPFSIWEDEDHFYMEADLPGVVASDIDVTVHEGLLTLKAERKPDEGRTYLYNGRVFGKFERVVKLPDGASGDDVEATLSNGVLRLSLKKAVEAKPKKIEVRPN